MRKMLLPVTLGALMAGVLSLLAIEIAKPAELETERSGEVRALFLVCQQYGANHNLLRDEVELRGWDVTVTALTETIYPCYWGGPITPDILLTDIPDVSAYDVLIISPARAYTGTSHWQLLASPEALAFVAQAVQEGLLVAAFCGGTRVLAAAGVIEGKQVTGHELYAQEYIDAGATYLGDDVPPVQDGNILTCVRGQYFKYQVVEVMVAAVDSLRALAAR